MASLLLPKRAVYALRGLPVHGDLGHLRYRSGGGGYGNLLVLVWSDRDSAPDPNRWPGVHHDGDLHPPGAGAEGWSGGSDPVGGSAQRLQPARNRATVALRAHDRVDHRGSGCANSVLPFSAGYACRDGALSRDLSCRLRLLQRRFRCAGTVFRPLFQPDLLSGRCRGQFDHRRLDHHGRDRFHRDCQSGATFPDAGTDSSAEQNRDGDDDSPGGGWDAVHIPDGIQQPQYAGPTPPGGENPGVVLPIGDAPALPASIR